MAPLNMIVDPAPVDAVLDSDVSRALMRRVGGGRAAVFHEGTVHLSHTVRDADPRAGIAHRFERMAALIASAVRELGIDARVGEVAGEYCPGAHSVNARGAVKLAGLGQRVVRDVAHVGAVLAVSGADRIREVLVPVNEALDLPWDPAVAGSLADERAGIAWERAAGALESAYAGSYGAAELV